MALAAGQSTLTRALTPGVKSPATTTNSAEGVGTEVPSSESIEEKLAKARADLEAASPVDASVTNRVGGTWSKITLRRALLQRLTALYEQQINYLSELKSLKERRIQESRDAAAWTMFSELRPYSILLTDRLRESIDGEKRELASGEETLAKLAKLSEEQRTLLTQAEEKIRKLNERLETDNRTETSQERDLERLRSQVAAATLTALDLERQIREERLAVSRVHLALLQRQLVIAKPGATFSDHDFSHVLARLDTEQQQLEQELVEAGRRRSASEVARNAAADELNRTNAGPDINAAAQAVSRELLEVKRAEVETAEIWLSSVHFMRQASAIERAIWEARFASYRTSNVETLSETQGRLEKFRRRVELWAAYYRQQREDTSRRIALLEERLADVDTSAIEPVVRQRLAALLERDQILLRVVRRIERGERLVLRLEEDVKDAQASLPFAGRMRNAVSDSGSFFRRVWQFELFVAEDSITVDGQKITGKRSVTLGKIVSAILILVVGFWLTGLLSRVMEPVFIKRLRIDVNQANLIRRWFRVVLVVSLTLFSLVSVKIPLTVFAFAGGALVIGLGFGTQTLLKNFVSGVIILFERPFRVGDVLDVAGQRGTIVSIGIRSSVLQQWDSTETLIPNSTLLENSVTNWTYSNRKVRFTVKVGVAYGSDTRQVVQLLTEIAGRHGLVETNPAPQILFVNFGDSTLDFELRYWVNVITANSSQVGSDLRQMIAGTFAEHGITIAFPQRDLHIFTEGPLPVQVVPPSTNAPPAPEKTASTGNAPAGATDSAPGISQSKPAPRIP